MATDKNPERISTVIGLLEWYIDQRLNQYKPGTITVITFEQMADAIDRPLEYIDRDLINMIIHKYTVETWNVIEGTDGNGSWLAFS